MKYRPDFITNSSSFSTVIVTNEQFKKMTNKEIDSLIRELEERFSKMEDWWRPDRETLQEFVLYLLGRTCIKDDSLHPQAAAYIDANRIRYLCGTDSGGMYSWTYYPINHNKAFKDLQKWGIIEVIDEGQFQDDEEGFEDEYMICGLGEGPDVCNTCVHRLSKLVTGFCKKCRKTTRQSI